MPPYRFLNCVYTWCLKRLSKDTDQAQFDEMLRAPLPGMEPAKPTPMAEAEEGELFMAAMQTLRS